MPIGTSKAGLLGGGVVPGGSQVFNSSGTFVVPAGVTLISSVSGSGTAGNSGNAGSVGGLGAGGSGGAGGNAGNSGLPSTYRASPEELRELAETVGQPEPVVIPELRELQTTAPLPSRVTSLLRLYKPFQAVAVAALRVAAVARVQERAPSRVLVRPLGQYIY